MLKEFPSGINVIESTYVMPSEFWGFEELILREKLDEVCDQGLENTRTQDDAETPELGTEGA
jgi:hypothetical protein